MYRNRTVPYRRYLSTQVFESCETKASELLACENGTNKIRKL
ncbi:hypothetical protein UVI_02011930 [Ustilaginoidea virens]|uniref:Uncharacterized protein n=1 Tax=Ustilaginoidea virens TaxID=1159556 RepID=A0A1B5L0H7_USTVR|nr:hypothetical protein UVI_02011930 [Ustilaginoidea virens]